MLNGYRFFIAISGANTTLLPLHSYFSPTQRHIQTCQPLKLTKQFYKLYRTSNKVHFAQNKNQQNPALYAISTQIHACIYVDVKIACGMNSIKITCKDAFYFLSSVQIYIQQKISIHNLRKSPDGVFSLRTSTSHLIHVFAFQRQHLIRIMDSFIQ